MPNGAVTKAVGVVTVVSRRAARARTMLQLRPNCECSNRDLPPEARGAMICSIKCTFYRTCASDILGWRCPNCGVEAVAIALAVSSAAAE
jgi:hypothetical protein